MTPRKDHEVTIRMKTYDPNKDIYKDTDLSSIKAAAIVLGGCNRHTRCSMRQRQVSPPRVSDAGISDGYIGT